MTSEAPAGERARIRAFLLRYVRNPKLDEKEDIFAAGYVTSLFAMQLVTFVEKSFGIRVENEDLRLDNFRSIDAIARLVERKGATAQP